MQNIKDLCQELKLNEEQSSRLAQYISDLTIELLQSIKEDNDRNFDETIASLKND